MTLRIPTEGEGVMLGISLGKTAVEGLRLRLYSNNKTPAEGDTMASYTEVSGGGYANILLTAANWVLTDGDPALAAYPQQTITFTGAAGDVYGYYVTGETSGKVRWAERFPTAPYNIALAGDAIKVTLQLTLQDTLD